MVLDQRIKNEIVHYDVNRVAVKILASSPGKTPSRQILLPRTSRGRPPPTSLERPLKILFDHPRDVPSDLTSWGRPGMMSRGRPNLTFKGRPWEVDSGRPQNVSRPSKHGLGQCGVISWIPKIYFHFSFGTYSIDQII